jgi:hypothetical protein
MNHIEAIGPAVEQSSQIARWIPIDAQSAAIRTDLSNIVEVFR